MSTEPSAATVSAEDREKARELNCMACHTAGDSGCEPILPHCQAGENAIAQALAEARAAERTRCTECNLAGVYQRAWGEGYTDGWKAGQERTLERTEHWVDRWKYPIEPLATDKYRLWLEQHGIY